MNYGDGTLRQKDNGRWQARYWGPDNRQHSKTFDRKTDAKAFLDDAQTDRRRGTWIDPSKAQTPFDEWAQEWMRGRHGIGDVTRARDESLLRNHVLPAFGSRPIGRIGPLEVKRWVNDLVAKDLSPTTIRACHVKLSSIMGAAVTAKIIGENPAKGAVDLPRIQRKRERFLTEAELERLALEFHPHHRPLIYAAAYTGCRWQELTGLLRPNLDLENAQLHVRTVVERVNGGRLKERPKSDAGRRTIALPQRLVEVLRFHVASGFGPSSEGGKQEVPLVFTAREGGMLREANFRRLWNPAVERADLAPLTFHDLRHTHVAWLIDAGVQEFKIVRRLGWTDSVMLHRVYGHLFPNAEDDLVADLDQRWESAQAAQ